MLTTANKKKKDKYKKKLTKGAPHSYKGIKNIIPNLLKQVDFIVFG